MDYQMDTEMSVNDIAFQQPAIIDHPNFGSAGFRIPQLDKNSPGFFIDGQLSYHEASEYHALGLQQKPDDGRDYLPFLFCRPAYPNIENPIRTGSKCNVIDHAGNTVVGFKWFSMRLGLGNSWYSWIAVDELPSDFWENKTNNGVMKDKFRQESRALSETNIRKNRSRCDSGIAFHQYITPENSMEGIEGGGVRLGTNNHGDMEADNPIDVLMGDFATMNLEIPH